MRDLFLAGTLKVLRDGAGVDGAVPHAQPLPFGASSDSGVHLTCAACSLFDGVDGEVMQDQRLTDEALCWHGSRHGFPFLSHACVLIAIILGVLRIALIGGIGFNCT
ncbi:hypothetical protein DKX38_003678 [Salix brachista]|uniref:Uncharacterized protein n=1 Tax=Salix brachista TaxID=2182728 RepID=A0A5N5NQK8_9ROSI|nr:hypothetical protein DKX38_003678 [Salix brachista]